MTPTDPPAIPVTRPARGPRGLWPLVALAVLGIIGCREQPAPPAATPTGPVVLGVPGRGAYTGAYIDFGEGEDDVTMEKIEGFERLVGKRQAIIASSSYWGEGTFPAENVRLIDRLGSVPLVFWSPWDKPYVEERGPDRFGLERILAGEHDAYIDRWGDEARAFGRPLLVSFCNEMNGSWFPWSGCFYGGKEPAPGGGFRGPETFKRAWRHAVDRVRARGATNVLWVFHVVNYSYPNDTWNVMRQYYPGPGYADWLGLSVYGRQFKDERWVDFAPLLDWAYKEMCMVDETKPIMLAEWGVADFHDAGDKGKFIRDAFAIMPGLPRLKAAVFWHERWQNAEGYYSNLRVNSSPGALAAYREGVAKPHWLERPIYVPRPE